MELIRRTKSLSPLTNKEIDAEIYRDGNHLYMVKTDEEGNTYKYMLEKDYDIYKRLTGWRPQKDLPINAIVLDISSRCNLNCKICYEPVEERAEITLDELKEYVSGFKDKVFALAGREPTMREDLEEIVRIIDQDNSVTLMTNGLKTADYSYLERLKKAGVKKCTVQFFGFDDEIYLKMVGSKPVLKEKLATLENCKKLNIPTCFSITVAKGVNDGEIKKLHDYAAKNDFIYDFRLRTCAPIGYHIDVEQYYISDLLKLLTEKLGFDKEDIFNEVNLIKEVAHTFKVNFLYPKQCSFFFHVKRNKDGSTYPVGRLLRGYDLSRLKLKKVILPLLALRLYGLSYMFQFALDRLAGRTTWKNSIVKGLLRVSLRSWPNIYNIDLEENRKCVTGYTKEGTCLKFCLRNILETNMRRDGYKPLESSYVTKTKEVNQPAHSQ